MVNAFRYCLYFEFVFICRNVILTLGRSFFTFTDLNSFDHHHTEYYTDDVMTAMQFIFALWIENKIIIIFSWCTKYASNCINGLIISLISYDIITSMDVKCSYCMYNGPFAFNYYMSDIPEQKMNKKKIISNMLEDPKRKTIQWDSRALNSH